MLKLSLIIAALAPLVLAVSVMLHNAISAWLGMEEPLFFVVAVVVAPLAFVIGVVGIVVSAVVEQSDRAAPR
jgi:hypothetical protein